MTNRPQQRTAPRRPFPAPASARVVAAAVLALAALAPVPATAEHAGGLCPAFPKVPWWNGLTHGKTIRYVLKDLNGDWQAHVRHFERVRAKLIEIRKKGGVAVITKTATSAAVRLDGARLDEYIENVEKRIAVVKCLAQRAGESYYREPQAPSKPARP